MSFQHITHVEVGRPVIQRATIDSKDHAVYVMDSAAELLVDMIMVIHNTIVVT